MDSKNKIIIFEDKKIRRISHNNEWFYSVVDIIEILTQSPAPRQYWGVLKKRESQLLTICLQLKLESSDGKKYNTDCVNLKSALRLIQSIPSKKAESLKLWLSQVGYERIEEIENPELGIQRNLDMYRKKGYSEEWIKTRELSIRTRKTLTSEWKNRGIDSNKDFALLTHIIHHGTFDIGITDHKAHKNLSKKNELRDHMSDIELALISLSEATTTQITKIENSKGLNKLSNDAKEGAVIGKDARKKIEMRLGKSIVSSENYLNKENPKKLGDKK